MPSELSPRDAELRRMLVAAADAAPLQRRRPRAVVLLTVFAISGALSGAAVSAAAAFTAESPTQGSVVSLPQSPQQLASMVRDDTQLFGSPFVLNPGTGNVTLEVGPAPEGATDLYIAFGCVDAGTYSQSIDGVWWGDATCDGPGGGSGGSYAVTGTGLHTLSISGPGDFVLWASWSAPSIPPEPSAEQAAALSDGVVTEAEYRAGFDRYQQCMTNAGHPLQFVNDTGVIVEYSNSGAAVQSGVEGDCYALEFYQLDMNWQVANEYESNTNIALRACLEAAGLTPAGTASEVWEQIEENNIDPIECTLGSDDPTP